MKTIATLKDNFKNYNNNNNTSSSIFGDRGDGDDPRKNNFFQFKKTHEIDDTFKVEKTVDEITDKKVVVDEELFFILKKGAQQTEHIGNSLRIYGKNVFETGSALEAANASFAEFIERNNNAINKFHEKVEVIGDSIKEKEAVLEKATEDCKQAREQANNWSFTSFLFSLNAMQAAIYLVGCAGGCFGLYKLLGGGTTGITITNNSPTAQPIIDHTVTTSESYNILNFEVVKKVTTIVVENTKK